MEHEMPATIVASVVSYLRSRRPRLRPRHCCRRLRPPFLCASSCLCCGVVCVCGVGVLKKRRGSSSGRESALEGAVWGLALFHAVWPAHPPILYTHSTHRLSSISTSTTSRSSTSPSSSRQAPKPTQPRPSNRVQSAMSLREGDGPFSSSAFFERKRGRNVGLKKNMCARRSVYFVLSSSFFLLLLLCGDGVWFALLVAQARAAENLLSSSLPCLLLLVVGLWLSEHDLSTCCSRGLSR